MIPFMPFSAFGGVRVWKWNKAVFTVLAIIFFVMMSDIIFGIIALFLNIKLLKHFCAKCRK